MDSQEAKINAIIDIMLDGILRETDNTKRKVLVEEFQIFSCALSVGYSLKSYTTAYPISESFSNLNSYSVEK